MSFKKILFGLILMSACVLANAQTWGQILSAAERDYEEGRLSYIPERLAGGFAIKTKDGGFTHEERIRAYKLITKVYIFIDDEPKSEEFLIYLLKEDKEHKLNPIVDPAELYFLYQKFRSKPILRTNLKFGLNKSLPNVLRTFSPGNTGEVKKIYNGNGSPPANAQKAGSIGLGYWVEAVAERHLGYGIEAGLGFQLRNSSYDVDTYVGNSQDGNPALSTYVSNQQVYFRVPAFFRYNFRYFKENGVIPYINLGASYDYLVNAQYTEATRGGGTQFVLSNGNNLKDLEIAKWHSMSFFGTTGVKLRVKTHFITFEMRYDKSMFNYINTANRWSGNQFLTYELAFTEDDLALDMLSFSVGFTYSIYSPKKLKEFR